MSELTNKVTRGIGKVKLSTIKHSPELLLAAGIISGAATIFFAAKGTLKAGEVIDAHKEKMDQIHEATEVATVEEYSAKDAQIDTVKTYVQTGASFAKIYAPAIIFGAVSLTCILASHGIMRKRNVALAATLATVRTAFDEYRGRVVRDLGKEMDNHFLYDTVEEVVEKEITDPETGKTKKKKEKVQVPTKTSIYSRFFDEANKNWEKDGYSNYFFIKSQINYLQNNLIRDGYLFLNDVYKALGFPISQAGQTAGWIYDFDNKENTQFFIDGFTASDNDLSQPVRDLMNGYNRNVLLNFVNIKDDILTDLPRVNSEVAPI
ncbi:DUF6353 family protein [Butyrivibrio sp. INlla21]|uniref:DUF6353 family protein n=1 Tax=Butyrivibrio sp. INlla21 TaxID=1520811 RepID=UPI0008EB5CE5|nr:DUF6353 family protein [Butyrivibrio sp. INlla21]SFU32891.1 hypothetical protein SAMN02910342_00097 [Butyrivibrio sp. INlla21]